MSLKLLTYPALARSQKILITAQYARVSVEVDENVTAETLETKSLHKTVPLLETPEGVLSESNAIARYIALSNPESKVYAGSAFELAQIDSWVDFCANSIEIPATMWIAPILGWMEHKPEVAEQAKKDLLKAISALEKHLTTRTFFVGRAVSLADIAIVTALLLPLKLVLDAKLRAGFPNVVRWFDTCVHQAEFVAVIGEVTLCEAALQPVTTGKGSAAKQEKKRKEQSGEATEKKTKSSFSLDAWKSDFIKAPNGDHHAAMPLLWKEFDASGYSIFIQKAKSALTDGHKASSLINGFVQRSESARKDAFGVVQAVGQEGGPIEIVGAWIIRGDSIAPLALANPETDSYEWEKVTDLSDANKQKIADLFCAWEAIDGKKILDCKIFR